MAVDRKILAQALKNAGNIEELAQNPRNWDHRGGWGVALAQMGTSGIGAYAKYKALQGLKKQEAKEINNIVKNNPELQGMNHSIETLQAYQNKKLSKMLDRQYPDQNPKTTRQLDFEYYESLPPHKRTLYDKMRRGDKLQNKGLYITNDGNIKVIEGYNDSIKGQEYAKSYGKKDGEYMHKQEVDINNQEAGLKNLERQSENLYQDSKEATFTTVGKIGDIFTKEILGFDTKGATARKRMEAQINQVILPNLKNLLGAQFTAKEFEAVRQTLVDPNSSPETRKAMIDQYINNIRGRLVKEKEVHRKNDSQNIENSVINFNDLK